jgi:hypothetical protein
MGAANRTIIQKFQLSLSTPGLLEKVQGSAEADKIK